MDEELAALRAKIDKMDRELVVLLARRMETADQIIRLKVDGGKPRRAPAREREILDARRTQAAELGVPPTLIGDVLRRIFRESYGTEEGSSGGEG